MWSWKNRSLPHTICYRLIVNKKVHSTRVHLRAHARIRIFYNRKNKFHVSVLCFISLKINRFRRWNIVLQCFIFSFNVSSWFQRFIFWFLKFHFFGISVQIKNIEGEKWKHARRKIKTCSKQFQNMLEELRLKHWNQDWNIHIQCFSYLTNWLSMLSNRKLKHETK